MIFQSHGKMQDYAELFDSDRKDNEQPSGRFATIKEKKNPRTVRYYGSGIRSLITCHNHVFFLPIGIIAYVFLFFNMQKKEKSLRAYPRDFRISVITAPILVTERL